VSKHRAKHRVTVAKRTLFGSRRWWAVCNCKAWFQGYHDKNEARRTAAEHESKENTP